MFVLDQMLRSALAQILQRHPFSSYSLGQAHMLQVIVGHSLDFLAPQLDSLPLSLLLHVAHSNKGRMMIEKKSRSLVGLLVAESDSGLTVEQELLLSRLVTLPEGFQAVIEIG